MRSGIVGGGAVCLSVLNCVMIAPRGDETIATRSGLVAVTRHAALSVYDRGGGAVCLSVWNYFTIAPRGNETVAKRRKRWRLLEVRNLEVSWIQRCTRTKITGVSNLERCYLLLNYTYAGDTPMGRHHNDESQKKGRRWLLLWAQGRYSNSEPVQ